MKIRGRVLFFIFIFLIIIGLVAFRVITKMDTDQDSEDVSLTQNQEERIIPVQTTKVEKGNIKSFLTVSGLVEPKETVRVFPKSAGQVKEIIVEEGNTVNKNDILLRLDDEQIGLQVAQAKANLDSAQASLEKVKAGARPQEISQVEAAVRQSKINKDSSEENYLLMQRLFSEGAVSEQQFEQAKNQFEIAEAQYQSASESYKLVLEGASEQDLRVMEAQVRQAQSALELAQSQLNNSVVRAPISGKIGTVSTNIGEIASSAMPVLVIVDTSELYVNTGISERDVAAIQVGQQAEVFIDAFSQTILQGEVASKGIMVDPTSKMMNIKIKIIDADLEIPLGVFAKANITIKEKIDILKIPDTALTRKKDGIYVFVLREELVEQRVVVPGISQDNQVEILQGLTEDEEIVISGNLTLQDGDKVRVSNREDR